MSSGDEWTGFWMATCSPGDSAWRSFKFSLPGFGFGNFMPNDVTYLAGSFYCITTRLEVGVFNLSTPEWQILYPSSPKPCFDDDNYYGAMVHSDEDLLWYECECKDVEGPGEYSFNRFANIWRFDFVEKLWIKEKNLGNRTIFSCELINFSVGAVGKGRDTAGVMFSVDQCVSIDGKNIEPSEDWAYDRFREWMVKEKTKYADLWSLWIDPRPVWWKSDLIKHG